MHSSPARRAAKALTVLVVAAGLALAAAPAGPSGLDRRRGDRRSRSSARSCPMSRARPSLSSRWTTAPAGSRRLTAIPPPASSFAYVLSGTIRSQVEGEPLGVYSAGQTWTEPPNAHHIVSANASKTEPARLIAYIIADDGAQATVYDK